MNKTESLCKGCFNYNVYLETLRECNFMLHKSESCCPCVNCLVKVMCVNACLSYDKSSKELFIFPKQETIPLEGL
jgi:hypothetical protein